MRSHDRETLPRFLILGSVAGAIAVSLACIISGRPRDIETLALAAFGLVLVIRSAVRTSLSHTAPAIRIGALVIALAATGAVVSPIWGYHSGYHLYREHFHFIWDISHVH